jgi:hypothetical protein
VYISGRDEKDAVLERLPELLHTVVDVFQDTTQGREGDGYNFGMFKIPFLVGLVAVLAISDANKRALLENEHVLSLIVSVLRRFQENQPEYSGIYKLYNSLKLVGGGGKDTESLTKAIEALLQLSFFYAAGDVEALRERFLKADPDLVKLLTDLVENPPRPLDKDDKTGLSALLQRLVVSVLVISSEIISLKRKHVMISYGECVRDSW